MSAGRTIKKYNPLNMSEEDVLALATGREKILHVMLKEMKSCLDSNLSQHYVFFGPRGIGKSYFMRLLNIHHDNSKDFNESIFIQFPEELDNVRYVSDLLDMISIKLEGEHYVDSRPRWESNDFVWEKSKRRLKSALEEIAKNKKKQVFIGVENLQNFIPALDDIENGRLREFLSDYSQISLIGSSLRPDLDSNYNKKLFQVFKKIDIEPWREQDFLDFYKRKVDISRDHKSQRRQLKISKNKIKAITAFTGGSPRLAVILSRLVLDEKILETADLLDGIIDDLTAYYQDLTKDIPPKSKALFDMLIRIGENVTQSELANAFDPPLQQKTIARSFNWLVENYYVVSKKQAKGNTKHYYVRDRLYVLYSQKRQIFADQRNSFVGVFVDFLTAYFSINEWKEQINEMDLSHPYSKPLLISLSDYRGLKIKGSETTGDVRNNVFSDVEAVYETKFKSKEGDSDFNLKELNDVQIIYYLFKTLLIQSNFDSILKFDEELPNNISKVTMIGRALGGIILNDRIEHLPIFRNLTELIASTHPEWMLEFMIGLTVQLSTAQKPEVLDLYIDELSSLNPDNIFTNLIIECWRYLQDPENQDIAKLHPDARLVALKILETENRDFDKSVTNQSEQKQKSYYF